MLGVEPQTKLNCEVLDSSQGFEVRWAIAGKSIVTQLVAKLDDGEYMAFGLSGDSRRTKMIGGKFLGPTSIIPSLRLPARRYYEISGTLFGKCYVVKKHAKSSHLTHP